MPEPEREPGQEAYTPYPAWDEPDPAPAEQPSSPPPPADPAMVVVPHHVVSGKVHLDPHTGEALSPHSRWVAAFLQLFLGGIGAGRFYIGDRRTGFKAMLVLLLCIVLSVLQPPFFWVLWIAFGLWCFADFIMMISGNMRDHEGRKLH
ncbi:MAG: TM2 domain-containing protein [Propionicimonas sp.]|nr:TM2 domain-containing protein [Propionicimonas sp.]MEA5117355.1 TM2 domain-containing protein [Propionicimonas sp.]